MTRITNDLALVIHRLRMGDIAAIPTETVYGLAADACSESAIRQVFSTKKRPADHPLIMHVSPEWDLTQWVSHIPDYAYALMASFWPGPLTLILPMKSGVIHPLITGGQSSIAIRAPKHPVAEQLLLEFGHPLVAPSANPYGKISPTTAAHVQDSFPTDDFLILDGGRCRVGVESTIVSALADAHYQIVRPGIITEGQIATIASCQALSGASMVRAPGGVVTHYQPEKTVFYCDDLETAMHVLVKKNLIPYVFTFLSTPRVLDASHYQFPENSDEAAYELYYRLRIADQSEADCILIELPVQAPAWFVIRERILKAGRPIYNG